MKRRIFLLAALLTAPLAACATSRGPVTPDRPAPPTTPSDTASVVASSNRFAMAMFEQLRAAPGNFAMSPASIGLALNMTRAGARGETAAQMTKVLHITLEDDRAHNAFGNLLHGWNYGERPYTLAVANRLFGEQSVQFDKQFLAITKDSYGAELEPVDFKGAAEDARDNINGWVEQKTHKRIVDLLPAGSVDADTRLVLTNAIYFKGKWKQAFDEGDSRDATFHAASGEIQVPTMFLTADFAYAAADGMKMVELPYQGDALSMTIIVPDAVDGIADLETKVTDDNLTRWRAAASTEKVMVQLPRFKIDPPTAVKLKPMLIAMGMADAFDAKKADLTGIARLADGSSPVIDDAYHKAFVEVNEEGTEAAAATAVVASYKAAIKQDKQVVADRPFIFLIRDTQSGAILFMGRVLNPASAA